MDNKLTPYLIFASGALAGAFGSYVFYTKTTEKATEKIMKLKTVASLVLDMDKWIWSTIDNTEDIEGWTQELSERLEYIEMVIALYSVEE